MPAFTSPQSPTALSSGEKLAVLNAENLAENALTMAVALEPQPQLVALSIYNGSGETVALVASPTMTADDFFPVTYDGTPVTAASDTVTTVEVASSLFYAVQNGAVGAITDGTIWLAR
jgi:hypothetical protein